jgi:hypothetical protein
VDKVAKNANVDMILVGGIGSPTFAPLVGGADLTASLGIPADALPAFAVRELAGINNQS